MYPVISQDTTSEDKTVYNLQYDPEAVYQVEVANQSSYGIGIHFSPLLHS